MDRVTSVITVDVVTLDRITELSGVPDVLVVDAQGRESSVLRSGDLSETSVVVVETCTVDDPTMASPYTEVVDLMQSFGFRETDHWDRDYTFVNRFARGPEAQARPGQFVRDVVFVNANLLR
jgi:O-methyltransferase involved in polyketide biosynthesis